MKYSLSLVMLLCSITFAQKMIDDEFKLSGDLRSPKFQYDHAQILHGENVHLISIDQVATSSGPITPHFVFKGTVNSSLFVEDSANFAQKVNQADLSSVSVNDNGQFYVSSYSGSIEGLWRGNINYLNQVRSAQYEIRFGADDEGLAFDWMGKIIKIPFTAWDIGGTINNPDDDQPMLICILNISDEDGQWGIRPVESPWTLNPASQSDRIYLYYYETASGPAQLQQAYDIQQYTGIVDVRFFESMRVISNEVLSRTHINSLDSNPLTTINSLNGLPRPRDGTILRWTFYVPLGFLIENLYAAVNNDFVYTPKVKGSPKPVVSAVNLPSGMNLNSTGALVWMPSPEQKGNNEIVISATNEQGTVQGVYPVWVDPFEWQFRNHDNNNIICSVFNNGYFGQSYMNATSRAGRGVEYFGLQGLYAAQLIIGASPAKVSARLFSNHTNHRFTTASLTETVPSPIPYYTQCFQSAFDDNRAPDPIGINIVQHSYSRTSSPDDDYVVLDYDIFNTTGQILDGVYVGIFADWDIGDLFRNVCGFDLSRKLNYMYEATPALNPNYYGIVILRGEVSGSQFEFWSYADSLVYENMHTIGTVPTDTSEYRSFLSSGPYSIPANKSVRIVFAIVCGTSFDDLMNNTDAARTVNLNRKPLLKNPIVDLSLGLGTNYNRNLTESPPVFIEMDGDPLSFNASSSNSTVAQATLAGSTLTVNALTNGTATITLTASDGQGGTETTTFQVNVTTLPTAITEIPADITQVSAKLQAAVNPNGYTTHYIFEYGLTTVYGDTAQASPSPLSATGSYIVTAVVTDLTIGTTYHYRVVASYSNGKISGGDQQFKTLSYPANYTVNTTITFPNLNSPDEYLPTDYRLVGLPGEDRYTTMATLLTGKQGVNWEVFWDNGAAQDYLVKYDDGSEFKMLAGRAFWILHKGDWVLNSTPPTAPLKSAAYIEVILHNGWNLITNPFDVTLSWAKVQTANSVTAPIWVYNGLGGYQMTNEFAPLKGYYYYNNASATILQVPIGAILTKPIKVENITWQVRIVLNSSAGNDASTWFGVAAEAVEEWDELDFFKPRAVGAIPNVYFEHRDWNESCSSFARDIRPPFKSIEDWTFQVLIPDRQAGTLTFEDIENVPAGYEIYLIDAALAKYQNLRDKKEYAFIPVKEKSEFKVIVGQKDQVLAEVDKIIPTKFTLGPNFPNPFNPITTVPVAIPEASKVTITIFNILGQEIRVLNDGILPVGRHYFDWNGTNTAGNNMPSGVYLYRLSTDKGINLSGKMVLIR